MRTTGISWLQLTRGTQKEKEYNFYSSSNKIDQ